MISAFKNKLRLIAVLFLSFKVIAVDFTSYVLSAIGDAFFIGALIAVIWPVINNKSAE